MCSDHLLYYIVPEYRLAYNLRLQEVLGFLFDIDLCLGCVVSAVRYGILDVPVWYETVLLGFQVPYCFPLVPGMSVIKSEMLSS